MKIIKKVTPVAACLLTASLMSGTAAADSTMTVAQQTAINHFKALREEQPKHYSQCEHVPSQVGKENFQEKHLSLSGLKGVHLDVKGLLKSAGTKNVKMIDKLEERIRNRLVKGGLKLLTKKEMERTHGQPEMNMYMSFPAHLSPAKNGKKIPYRKDCCQMGIWTSFSQAAQILRDPETNYKLGTWGTGHNTGDCSNPAGWMSEVILKTIDTFVADKLKGDRDYAKWMKKRPKTKKAKVKMAEAKAPMSTSELAREVARELAAIQSAAPRKPKKAAKPKVVTLAKPVDCTGSVKTYLDMFATNESKVNASKHFVLDELARSIRGCPMYNYVIETHTDSRSSNVYNERLSALRAASIQNYLLAQQVPKSRFIVQSYGEIMPVTAGRSESDYAVNRRVVVRPFRHN